MDEKSISFWYLNNNFTLEYKNKVLKYLRSSYESFKEIGEYKTIIDFHGFEKEEDANLTGFLFIQDLEGGKETLQKIFNYILSKERAFIPVAVSCENKEDYGKIEEILKENYGKKARLTNGFLGIGKLFNHKDIKARTI